MTFSGFRWHSASLPCLQTDFDSLKFQTKDKMMSFYWYVSTIFPFLSLGDWERKLSRQGELWCGVCTRVMCICWLDTNKLLLLVFLFSYLTFNIFRYDIIIVQTPNFTLPSRTTIFVVKYQSWKWKMFFYLDFWYGKAQ